MFRCVDATSSANVASFHINDGPVFIDTINVVNKNDKTNQESFALLCAVTSKGSLYIYNHHLEENTDKNNNNKLKKPIKALNNLKIETDDGQPITIYGCFVTNMQNERLDRIELNCSSIKNSSIPLSTLLSQYMIYLVYGSHLNPKIEKMQFTDLNESKMVLKREDPLKTTVLLQTQSTKVHLRDRIILRLVFFSNSYSFYLD